MDDNEKFAREIIESALEAGAVKKMSFNDSTHKTRCLWEGVDKDKPMGLSCPCPKCSPQYN